MNRKAVLLYLENVRDLEVIRYFLKKNWDEERQLYDMRINHLPTTAIKGTCIEDTFPERFRKFILYVLPPAGFLGGLLCFGPKRVPDGLTGLILVVLLIISIAMLVFGGIPITLDFIDGIEQHRRSINRNQQIEKKYSEDVEMAKKNSIIVQNLKKEREEKRKVFQQRYTEVQTILNDFYDMNIIPVQYRNLPAIVYINDYMQSSNEALRDAFLSHQINDGIQRIEGKLDTIIHKMNSLIYEQRVMNNYNRDNIKRQIDMNNQMIASFKRMESHQENVEEYTRLSANYNRAQVLISVEYY